MPSGCLQSSEHSSLVRPAALCPGDTVAIIAPSFPHAVTFPERFRHGLEMMRQSLEVNALVCKHVSEVTGFTSGTPEQRAGEIQAVIADPDVKAIFTTLGGFNSAELIPLIDHDVIRANPKIYVGYSDTTALLLAFQHIAGLITFHGPAVMPQLGEYPRPLQYTIDSLRRILCQGWYNEPLEDPDSWTDEFLDWGTDAWRSRPRRLTSPAASAPWREGEGEGQLLGGNIETLNMLLGTPFIGLPDEIVLFWEVTAEEAYLPRVQRALTHLRQAGVLDRTAAMLVGRCPSSDPVNGVTLKNVVMESVKGYDFPVIGEVSFGHTDPMMTVPIGVRARASVTARGASVCLLEPAVTVQSR